MSIDLTALSAFVGGLFLGTCLGVLIFALIRSAADDSESGDQS